MDTRDKEEAKGKIELEDGGKVKTKGLWILASSRRGGMKHTNWY